MQKFLEEILKFQKLPFTNCYFKENILLSFIVANKRNRMFIIENQQIHPSYIEKFEEFFTIVDIGEKNKFILLDKDAYYLMQNSASNLNNSYKIILKYAIFPAVSDEVSSTAIIDNKLFLTNTLRIPLLGKEDIASIIDDSAIVNL